MEVYERGIIMTKMGEENRKVTDEIDAVGNTTKAVFRPYWLWK